MKRYTIGIDCRLAGLRHAGIGRYIIELVKQLVTHTDVNWVLFFSDNQQVTELFAKQTPSHCAVVFTPVKHYSLSEQLLLPRIFNKAQLDLLHVPHFNIPIFYNKKLAITIHDLLWHEHRGNQVTTLPPWQYWIKYFFYRLITRIAAKKALTIFVPTHTVRNILVHYYPSVSKKVVVTPEAVGTSLAALAKNKSTHKRQRKQLLYVGSLYPHKNITVVLEALATNLTDYSLIIVGSRSVFRSKTEQRVHDLHLNDRVIFDGSVNDETLAAYYQSATALVQPSFSEGFGLTGLEAMTFGTPVLASDIPVFREVYQSAALYFDPHSAQQFATSVRALEKTENITHLKLSSATISKQHDWKTLADKTYQQYLSLLK